MENPSLADDLQREFDALADRRAFGLNFERHVPEAVELRGRKVRKGDKVRILPPRGEKRTAENDRLWQVVGFDGKGEDRSASLVSVDGEDEESALVADLVVVAEFRDPIYPGLVSTGKVERGGDKPFHTVINAENFHALQTLLFTHRGKVDCIYIDPPYNTGAKDWKYNNDYVEGDDHYRHSKWLAFMERRLLLAKELLDPDDSVLIVTIDEKEYLRLGLLLEQTFAGSDIQMVSDVINPGGSARVGRLSRTDEYIFYVFIGEGSVIPALNSEEYGATDGPIPRVWFPANRGGTGRALRSASPNLFYPVFLDKVSKSVTSVGEPIPPAMDRGDVDVPAGTEPLWPLGTHDREQTWRFSHTKMRSFLADGTAKVTVRKGEPAIQYLRPGTLKLISEGVYQIVGRDDAGGLKLDWGEDARGKPRPPKTAWALSSHSAQYSGTRTLRALIGNRDFPFPKSIYAVEDSLRYVVTAKPEAVVLDFFCGSATTAHAVMRLNRQDGGSRQSIMVTNNDVASAEQRALTGAGLRAGDRDWEKWGICEFIAKPRVTTVVTGITPEGGPIQGEYRFTDEFPMAEGFEENVEFFTLTYEAPLQVSTNREFTRIAPLLWMRTGSVGRRIDDISTGWHVADVYGVIADLDQSDLFLKALAENKGVTTAFIVTDEDALFEAVVAELPDRVEPVRLYEAYLRNFEIEAGRSSR